MLRSLASLRYSSSRLSIATKSPSCALLVGRSDLYRQHYTSLSRLLVASSSRHRRQSSHAAAATSVMNSSPLPPNLKMDPKSSFARIGHIKPTVAVDEPLQEQDDVAATSETNTTRRLQDDESLVDESDLIDYEDDDDDDDDFQWLAEPDIRYAIPLPDRLNASVHSLFASSSSSSSATSTHTTGTLWLDAGVFGRDPIRVDLLKRAVDYYRAKKRGVRKAVTKTISHVSGSGSKVRQQKGTGKARMGHSRPAHHRGGAKAHGPKNITNYGATKLNKRVRKLALSHALSQKLLEGNLILLNSLHELPTHKTKEFAQLLQPLGIGGRHGTTALILDSYHNVVAAAKDDQNNAIPNTDKPASFKGVPVNVVVASANMHNVTVGNDHQGSVYAILKHEKLVLTLAALERLESRLKDL